MAASGMGSLILVNNGTHDSSSRSSLEVYWKIVNCTKSWKCLTKEEISNLLISVNCRLDAIVPSKAYAPKYYM